MSRSNSTPAGDADRVPTTSRQHPDGKAYEYDLPVMHPMEWDLVSRVIAASRMARVLRTLDKGAVDQRTISRLAGLERSNARKALRELCLCNLAQCLTPERPRARIYTITEQGRRVLRHLPTEAGETA